MIRRRTHAERYSRKRGVHRALSPIAREVQRLAEQTGDRAYQFHACPDGSLLEIRVWPDGGVKLTPVDESGRPLVGDPPAPLRLV